MAQELTALPEEFPAGTTVRYRKSFSDYPASAGWTLTLYLGGASPRKKTAVPDGDDFVVTLAAADTGGDFLPGFYQAAERASNSDGDVYEVWAKSTNITPNLAEATEGSSQNWVERAIPVLQAALEVQAASGGMVSYQLAGRGVTKETRVESLKFLAALESRLAHLRNPDAVIRPILASFGPGFSS